MASLEYQGLLLTEEGEIASISRTLCHQLGFRSEELSGQSLSELAPHLTPPVASVEDLKSWWRRRLEQKSKMTLIDSLGRRLELDAQVMSFEAEGRKFFFISLLPLREMDETARDLRRHHDLLRAIADAQSNYIDEVTPQTLFNTMLEQVLALTDSEYGFIGEVHYSEEKQQRYLRTHAITNVAWDDATRKFFEANVSEGFEFFNLETLFGYTIHSGELVIANDPASDARSGGVPRGHPELSSYLGLPIYQGNKFVGMMGIANRPQGYEMKDVELLSPLLKTCASIIDGYHAATRQREAEMALRESEERLAEAQRIAHVGSWEWRIKEDTLHWSDEIYRIFGFTCDMVPNYEKFVAAVHPDERLKVQEAVEHSLKTGEPYVVEHRIYRTDGVERVLHEQGEVHYDEKGEPAVMIGAVLDITERKTAERMKDEFVSIVSHELRTPLTALRGSLGLLAGGVAGNFDPQIQHLLDISCRNTERLLELINDILDISKIESGKLEMKIERFSLLDLLNMAISENEPYARQFDVTLELQRGLPDVHLNVDRARFLQVMSNLISNAVKYGARAGRVEVYVKILGDELEVGVRDFGEGVPQDFRRVIFDKFTQADSSSTRNKGGTGLGLSIAKAIVENLGGNLDFDSVQGKGSTFFFHLPLKAA